MCMYNMHTLFSCSFVILRIGRPSPHPLLIPEWTFTLGARAGELTRCSRLPRVAAPVTRQHLPRCSRDSCSVAFGACSTFSIGFSHPDMLAVWANHFSGHIYYL